MAKGLIRTELSKPLAALIFLLCWAVAIVAWCFVPHLVGHGLRGFIADVGIIFAAIGFAAPFLPTKSTLGIAFGLGALGVVLFAVGDFFDIQILVYTLRLLAPTLAVFTPINRFSNTVKIWS